MMEGAYNKVGKAKGDIPAQSYAYFMDLLMHTVRDEIASCCIKAYNHLSLSEAQKLLGFASQQELRAYSEQVRNFVYELNTDVTLHLESMENWKCSRQRINHF
jgi:26S proteasome regulatory subunit N12